MPKDEKSSDKASNSDLEHLKELYNLMLEKGLDAVELKDEDSRIRLTRHLMPISSGPAPLYHPTPARPEQASSLQPDDAAEVAPPGITTPLAGVFYRASSPTSASFVKEGDTVDPGQTLCIVEAMKVMNEIKAETRCKIVKIVAENGRPLTSGQVLFHIEPA